MPVLEQATDEVASVKASLRRLRGDATQGTGCRQDEHRPSPARPRTGAPFEPEQTDCREGQLPGSFRPALGWTCRPVQPGGADPEPGNCYRNGSWESRTAQATTNKTPRPTRSLRGTAFRPVPAPAKRSPSTGDDLISRSGSVPCQVRFAASCPPFRGSNQTRPLTSAHRRTRRGYVTKPGVLASCEDNSAGWTGTRRGTWTWQAR